MEKFVKVPHSEENLEITPQDLLVYVNIRRFDNPEHACFPSLQKIADSCDLSDKTVQKCIKNLVNHGYITIEKKGRSNFYYFTDKQVNFEPFTEEFLDKKTISVLLKSFLIATQQHLIKDGDFWKTTYSQHEIAEKINMPQPSVNKCYKELEKANNLITVKTDAKDPQTGLYKVEKIISPKDLGLIVLHKIKEIGEQTNDNTREIETMKRDMEMLKKKILELESKQNKDLYL